MRGVGVNESYVTDQRSLDGNLGLMGGAASGGPDLTREQWQAIQKEQRRQFIAKTLLGMVFIFCLAWVIDDLTHFGDALFALASR